MKNIFLLGAYGQNNLGDDALLEVFLEQFREAKVVVNSAQPADTSRRYGVETVATYWGLPRFRRLRALMRSDLLVFGGGSLLKEIEGGLLARLLYFARIFALLLFCRLAGRPSAMLGVGIGPLDHPLYCRLSRLAAELTDLICVRDAASRDLLLAIGVRKTIHVTADPVFTLTTDDRRPTTSEIRSPMVSGQSSVVGGHPSVVVIPRYSLDETQQAALAAACDHLVEAYGARITFLPFQTGFRARFDDVPATRGVQARMRHAAAAELLVAETPRAALAAIGQADLVLSARLHGLIFATLGGVAAVALDYEVKVRSFMAETGQADTCVSFAELAAGALPTALDRAWERRAERGADVGAQVQSLRERATQNFTLARELAARPRSRAILTGGALLFASMTIVNLGNYLFNLILGRWLGPAAFADLSLIVTLLLMVTLITATLQTISAKFAAAYTADGAEASVYGLRRWLGRGALVFGFALLALLALGAPLAQAFFQTSSAWPFVILGIGLPLYFAQGVDRGILQGQMRFGPLALTYQAEMWVRLLAAVVFVALGWAINGAVAGLTLSLAATWLVGYAALGGGRRASGKPATAPTPPLPAADRRSVAAFAGPVVAALVGQVLINNSDILIVKHFFPAEAAGLYAALALIGRIVFFATVSVVAVMFPIAAQRHQKGLSHRHLLWLSLGLVALVSLGVIGFALVAPGLLVRLLFGAAYLPIAPLLWLYAVATALYALANVVISYRLSVGGGGGSMLAVLAGAAQVAGLWLFHGSLGEVVLVQVFLMAALLVALLIWDWRLARNREPSAVAQHSALDHPSAADPAGARPRLTLRVPVLSSRFSVLGSFIGRRWRTLLLGFATLVALLLMWQVARAEAPSVGHPAQAQIKQVLGFLMDSEAEHAAGAYIPGVGGIVELDLLRGPNIVKGKPSYAGTRDWAIYLMQRFGPKFTAVPPDEKIAFSVDFYDFGDSVYRQLVITCRAGDVADPAKYAIWLDGKPYDEVAAQAPQQQAQEPPAASQAPEPTAQPQAPEPTAAPQVAAGPTVLVVSGQPAVTIVAPTPIPAPAGPVNLALDFTTEKASVGDWVPVNGKWALTPQGYEQTELGKFDLITLLNRPISGDYRFGADVKFVEGEMGGGLLFNAPAGNSKNGAQMLSFTGKGTYFQWGYFDDGGVFQFVGGSPVPNGADGKPHALAVRVAGNRYNISLDGKEIVLDVPLQGAPGGRVGLLASTSHVVFDNLTLESK
jgi:polysaccharide pyruvyl transferase CsaB